MEQKRIANFHLPAIMNGLKKMENLLEAGHVAHKLFERNDLKYAG